MSAYTHYRAHSRHYRSEYVRGYLHRKRCVQPSRLVFATIPYEISIEPNISPAAVYLGLCFLYAKILKIMIELWVEAPERRMGNKQGIGGSQNLKSQYLSITNHRVTVRKKRISLSEYL